MAYPSNPPRGLIAGAPIVRRRTADRWVRARQRIAPNHSVPEKVVEQWRGTEGSPSAR
jgi:hypothetical protein